MACKRYLGAFSVCLILLIIFNFGFGDELEKRPAFKLSRPHETLENRYIELEGDVKENQGTFVSQLDEAFDHFSQDQTLDENLPSTLQSLPTSSLPLFTEFTLNPDDQPITQKERDLIWDSVAAFVDEEGLGNVNQLFIGYLSKGAPLRFFSQLLTTLEDLKLQEEASGGRTEFVSKRVDLEDERRLEEKADLLEELGF